MCESYARSLLRVSVAQMCQAMGWDAVQLSACDLLSDVLERYVQHLARSCHRYSELYGRTDPGLSDVDQAFGLLGVSIAELEDYVNNLEPVGFPQTIPQFPINKSSVLQFPASGFETDARDALRGERRDYIPEYFPPLVSLQEDEEEEEPVPADLGTSAEAMQVSLGEEEDGEEEENDENWLSRHEGQSPRPEGLLPAAKRPRLSTKPGVSPEWSYEPREPLSSLNSQHMPLSPSPPLSPELPRPPVAPPTPGHKPKLPSPSPARQKNKSPKRVGGTTPTGVLGRSLTLTPPKTNQKAGKRSPARPKSPRSPRPSPVHLGAAGRGWPGPPGDDSSRDGQIRCHDTGDEDIENSIAAVIARACAGGEGTSDPFAYDSDSNSEGPNPPKPVVKHPLSHIKPPQALAGKHPPPPIPPLLNTPNRWTMDDSIDEVIRKANQGQKPIQAPSLSPPEPAYLSSPSDSPPTPPPTLKLPQERKEPATTVFLKKKLKKDIRAKLKKKDREQLKEKGKDKGKNKDKNKEKKREKERGLVEENKMPWPELLIGGEEQRVCIAGKKEKDKHKDKKKDKEKSKKEKEKRDKGKERGKEEKRISLGAKDIAAGVNTPLFSPQTCLRIPSMLPPLPPILPDKLFPHPKDTKSKDKDKKKDKKEKKKKKEKDREKEHEKEREKERTKEKERDKDEKKKEKDKKEKTKEKEKEKPKLNKPSLMAEVPLGVPPSPVIPRLTLRVGAGQDKIVISKVVPDSEPSPPPPRTPVAKSGPGARMRFPPVPPPPALAPVVPPPRPPPVLPPVLPPAPIQPPPSQAKARGCSVVTETVSAYVIRDEWGNQIWICPGCNKPDDGSPMIGCDECDDWYHWPCVGILAAPPEDQSWFCVKCAGKKKDKKTKKRKRKVH
ncbi:transcription initiation factor TFIID subunit 3 isoform X1 [Xyrauchen texanus]|uniref:transcription initiation factor TFIID subunit 3 isoform X1 n=2 Tax=Xyrauchen texanus TaxID=154827 RepID=UPI002242A091|nr:transcription initiation factor TFIID subunit 3 isoform X1 [Xyrauchen texanus]